MTTHYIFLFLVLSSNTLLTYATLEQDTKLLGPLDKDENLTHFRFFWQDIVGAPNATSIPFPTVPPPPAPKLNPTTSFGLIRVIDNPLTIGPELTSRVVGRAEGIYTSTSQVELDLLMIQSFVFFEGEYNASTITTLGRNVALDKVREMPVVGGSGVFRFAKGYVQATTAFYDPITGNTTVQYDVYVSNY